MGRHQLAWLAALAVIFFGGVRPMAAVPVEATLGIPPGSLAGTDGDGRVLLYTPNPLEPGSSVSHFDISAFPNLLMEPSTSSSLGFAQLDLTTFQLRDVGWLSGRSNVTLRIQDAPGQGFNDPSLGARRRAAMQFAADVWAARLRSSVEINIEIGFQSLACSGGGGVLAQAGAQFVFESFPGAPISGTWYHGALAESLSGQNLSLEDVADPNAGDVAASFNSQIDSGCLGGGSRFYYGLDGNLPSGQISFVNVALHELAHGLGFASFTNDATGAFFMGLPDIYSRYIFDNDQGRSWTQMSNSQRRSSATNPGDVVWRGSRVTQQAPNFLAPAPALTVDSPASIAGTYQAGTAAFGPPVTAAGLSGNLALAVDGSASPSLLCNPVANVSEVTGRIAVVDRGTCNFTVKVKHAQNAGAIGVVVVNNVPGPPIGMGGTDNTIVIPSLLITQEDGELIKDTLELVPEPGSLRFSAAVFNVVEDAGTATVTVRRTGGTDGVVSADYATGGGTATAGDDYLPAAGTVTFDDGVGGAKSFEIEILDDMMVEGEETIDLVLSNPTGGAELGDPATAVLAIEEDDVNPAGFVAFGAPDYRIREGEGNLTVTVERTGGTIGAVSVDYATGGGTATAGEDYAPAAGSVAFADGEGGTKSFEIEILDDAEEEAIETIGLALSSPTGGALLGTPSSAIIDIVDNEACTRGDERLCLGQSRFRAEVTWRDFQGATGSGRGLQLASDDSGLFWFFSPNNLEMLVKVLDGCAINERFWVFAAATTNVEYTLQITDTETGQVKEYTNPLGVASPAITDTSAFTVCPEGRQGAGSAPAADLLKTASDAFSARPGGTSKLSVKADCQAGTEALCLNQGRFQVEMEWRDFQDATGTGRVEPLANDDSGLFWFFSPNNLEVLVKVLDGCAFNQHFWVFAAATTNVEYTLRVTDTETGLMKEYTNPLGVASPAITDTGAFATCAPAP